MWAREKARAERDLAELARDTSLGVISYRPAFVTPTEAEAHIGHNLVHAILAPIKMAVKAESIGYAMLEVEALEPQIPNGTVLESRRITELGRANENRRQVQHSGVADSP